MRQTARDHLSLAAVWLALVLFGVAAMVLVVLERLGLPASLLMIVSGLAITAFVLAPTLSGVTARPSRFFGGTRPMGAVSGAVAASALALTLAITLGGGIRGSTLLVPVQTGPLAAALLALMPAALVFAPLIRRSGAYSLPDFLSHRFEAVLPRLIAYLLLLVTLVPVVLASAALALDAASALTGLNRRVLGGPLVILTGVPLLVGGLRGLRPALLALAACMLCGLAVPVLSGLVLHGKLPATIAELRGLVESAEPLKQAWLRQAGSLPSLATLQGADWKDLGSGLDLAQGLSLVLGMSVVMLASGALVQVPTIRGSAGVVLLGGAALMLLPVLSLLIAAASLLHVEGLVVGQTAAALPARFQDGTLQGLLTLCGEPPTPTGLLTACKEAVTGFRAAPAHRFSSGEVAVMPALLGPGAGTALGLPAIAALLYRALPLFVALAALALSSFALAAALAHDGLLRLVRRTPSASLRLALARLVTLAVIAAAIIAVDRLRADLPALLEAGLALAGATMMPLLLVSLLPRTGSRTALLTLLGGLAVAAIFLLQSFADGQGGSDGSALRAGLYGAIGAFAMAGAGLASCPPGTREARFASALLEKSAGPMILDPAA